MQRGNELGLGYLPNQHRTQLKLRQELCVIATNNNPPSAAAGGPPHSHRKESEQLLSALEGWVPESPTRVRLRGRPQ